jgi:hypothetical protein
VTLTSRDRRAVAIAGACAAVFLAIRLWPESEAAAPMTAATIPQAEQRLQRLRQRAAAVPARKETLERVRLELARREKGLIPAETAALAQAQLLQITRRLLKNQDPPMEIRNVDLVPPQPFSDHYGQVGVTMSVEGNIEQLVNLLADLENQPELVAADDLQLGQANEKSKRIQMRLTITGLVSRKLVPDKKEPRGGLLF